ncbi:hypothetical protein RB594_009459 [Gaeumannomyces avenae]
MHYLKFTSLLGLCGVALGASNAKAASGCGSSAPPFKLGKLSDNQNITTKDGKRRYRVYLPLSYKQSQETPVILSFHGANGNIEKQCKLDGLTEDWRNNKYVVVYLQGLATPDDPTRTAWQVDPRATTDDLAFTAAVLDEVQSRLCVRASQVYAVGKSQGGGMVNLLACDAALGARVAAFAPVSGAYYIHNTSKAQCDRKDSIQFPDCRPSRKNMPLIAFHGGADPTIPFDGTHRRATNSCLPSIPHWINEWVKREGLDVASGRTTPIKGSKDGGNKTVWGGGSKGQVEFVYDGDTIPHDWPSMVPNSDNGGANLTSFNATEYILKFVDGRSL